MFYTEMSKFEGQARAALVCATRGRTLWMSAEVSCSTCLRSVTVVRHVPVSACEAPRAPARLELDAKASRSSILNPCVKTPPPAAIQSRAYCCLGDDRPYIAPMDGPYISPLWTAASQGFDAVEVHYGLRSCLAGLWAAGALSGL